jgi:hypothetical protein
VEVLTISPTLTWKQAVRSCGTFEGKKKGMQGLGEETRKKGGSYKKNVKLKQSLYRRGQAHGVPGSEGSQISRQSAHEGGKVVSHTHQPPLPPSKYSWYSFLLEAESTPGP